MKRTTVSIIVLACLVLALLIVTAFTAVSSASAQLGNTGVPVWCDGGILNPNTSSDFYCKAADGTLFGGTSIVPAGHYFLITDIVIQPGGGTPTGEWRVALFIKSGQFSKGWLSFINQGRTNFGEHFSTPYLVLSQGYHLQVNSEYSSSGWAEVYISGLLTTNVYYMPLMSR